MKKVYQIIASITMSLLVIGASAQTMKPASTRVMPAHSMCKQMSALHEQSPSQNNKTQRVLSATHVDVCYYNTDALTLFPSTFTGWIPPAYTNTHYGLADTGSGVNKNYNLNHAGIVAFDTILDAANIVYSPTAGSLSIDTLFLYFGYHNTSITDDTMIIHIGVVTPLGYPKDATYYTSDTVIVPPHSAALPGYFLDSAYGVYIIPNRGLGYTVPALAAGGYKFNVTVETQGSKLDTLGLWYGSPYLICTYPYAQRTGCGPTMGAAQNVNSFMTGYQFYNSPAFLGNGSVLTWPDSTGNLYNSAFSFGDYWSTTSCAGDTGYIYTQDLLIEAAVTFSTPLAVNNISSEGFSVNQNYPNPFNQNTAITYTLPKESNVQFTVYDMTGRELVNNNYATVAAGQHVINLDANQFTPGVYFYTFNVNGVKVTRKMVITQ